MDEFELVEHIERLCCYFSVEKDEDGEGFLACVDGDYLPNSYDSEISALRAIAAWLGVKNA